MNLLCTIPRGFTDAIAHHRTTDEWYFALAEVHIVQLVFQHNDFVVTADDCKHEYILRQRFRKLGNWPDLAQLCRQEELGF